MTIEADAYLYSSFIIFIDEYLPYYNVVTLTLDIGIIVKIIVFISILSFNR